MTFMKDSIYHPLPPDLSGVTIDTKWEYDYANRIKKRIRLSDSRVIETLRLTNAEIERYLAENPGVVLPIRGKQLHDVFSRKEVTEVPLRAEESKPAPSVKPIPESLQGRVFGNLTVFEDAGKSTVRVECKCGVILEKFNRKFLTVSGQKSCSRACPFSTRRRREKPLMVPVTPSMMEDTTPALDTVTVKEEKINLSLPEGYSIAASEPGHSGSSPKTDRAKTISRIMEGDKATDRIAAVLEAAKKINIEDVNLLLTQIEQVEIKIPAELQSLLGNPYLGLRKAKTNLRALGYFITSLAGTKE